jgi:tetratricopeptide (TPR) repeat protein
MIDKSAITKVAQKFIAKGQIDKAIEQWERVLKENPDGNVYNTVGDLYLRKGINQKAIELFLKAAHLFREDGFYTKAIGIYKKILNISPADITSHIALAELNAEKGLMGNAIDHFLQAADKFMRDDKIEKITEYYNKILSLIPNNNILKEKMAELYQNRGFKKEALREYLSAASDYSQKGQTTKAEELYSRIIELDPQNTDSLIGLSRIAEKAGDIQKAYEFMNKAIEISGDNSDILFHYSRLATEAGDTEKAKEILSSLLDKEPSNIHYKKLLGEILLKEGALDRAWEQLLPFIDDTLQTDNWSEAVNLLENFREKEPIAVRLRLINLYREKNNLEPLIKEMQGLAKIYEDIDKLEDALKMYRELFELKPNSETLREKVSSLEKSLGIKPEPIKITPLEERLKDILPEQTQEPEPTVTKAPDAIDELLAEAEFYEQQGLTDEAIKTYEKILSIDPVNKEIRAKLERTKLVKAPEKNFEKQQKTENLREMYMEAAFYEQQGLIDEAIKVYKKILSINPDNKELQTKIESLRSDKQPEKAAKEKLEVTIPSSEAENDIMGVFNKFKEGIDRKLGEKDYESHYNLGIAYKEMGLLDDAIKSFQIAAKDPKRTIQTSSMLGLCYKDKKLYKNAIESFKNAISHMSPKDKDILNVKLDLASAYEKNHEYENALKLYAEIHAKDPNFKDIKQRIENIKSIVSGEAKQKAKKKKRVSYI